MTIVFDDMQAPVWVLGTPTWRALGAPVPNAAVNVNPGNPVTALVFNGHLHAISMEDALAIHMTVLR